VGAAEPPALPLPDKPPIALLPFAKMSGDPEQVYFADGIVEEIIPAKPAQCSEGHLPQRSSLGLQPHAPPLQA
jgi:hypothetical protein